MQGSSQYPAGDEEHCYHLFGVATIRDVETLRSHTNAMILRNNKLTHAFQIHNPEVSSYMTAVNQRVDSAVKGIKDNHEMLKDNSATLQQSVTTINNMWTTVIRTMIDESMSAMIIEKQAQELSNGVYELIHNKLSLYIVPVEVMAKTLKHVANHLVTRYPMFHLVSTNPAYYYQTQSVVHARSNNSLYITVTFPITSSSISYDVYQVLAFPVPLNESTTHASMLMDHPVTLLLVLIRKYILKLMTMNVNSVLETM